MTMLKTFKCIHENTVNHKFNAQSDNVFYESHKYLRYLESFFFFSKQFSLTFSFSTK